jgi:NTP pyrophosphatase (non-canonical NTP hydrolase)
MSADRSSDDRSTTVQELRDLVQQFVDERDWRQFHSPKNLAMSAAIEAAELMEHFQWLEAESSREVVNDQAKMTKIGEELADVLSYCLALANTLGLDVSTILRDKMQKNAAKYPAEEFRGRSGKD